MTSPSSADAWELRSADLPPPEVMERTPELEDLENNVVYRSMLFGRRTRRSMPRLESAVGLLVLLLSSAALLSCFGPLFFFIAFPLSRYFRKPQANVIAFFGMPEILLRELIELRVPAREWTVALWGRSVSWRVQRLSVYLTFLWITLLFGYGILLLPDDLSLLGAALHASVAYLFGIRFGVTIAGVNRAAHIQLPVLLRRVRRFRRATMLANNPLGWLYALALMVGVLLIWFLVALIVSVLVAGMRAWFPRPLEAMAGGIWFLPVSTIVLPLVMGLLTGMVLVWVRLRALDARVGEQLEEINEEVEGMLRIMQGRFDFEGDERAEVPRLSYRPSGAIPPKGGLERSDPVSGVSLSDGEGP